MDRRKAIRLLATGVFAEVYADMVFGQEARKDGITLNNKGQTVNARTGLEFNTAPPKVLRIDLGKDYETMSLTWKGETIDIPMQEIWDALK